MSERILGLDLGITSIGWGLIEYNEENSKIIDSGVRIFTGAEHPKDGSSLALPRREARGARRATKRKRLRLEKIKKLFVKNGLATYDELFDKKNNIYLQENKKDVWQLRDKGLRRELEPKEFVRVLTHIAKHRGYKSNRKSIEKEDTKSDNSKALGGIATNEKLLTHYATIGQALYCSTKETTKTRRNHPVQKTDKNGEKLFDKKTGEPIMIGGFFNSVSREMLEEEVNVLFEKQQFFENLFATEDLKKEFLDLAFTQKGLASIQKMVGNCIFENKKNGKNENEKRAPKRSLSAEEFVTLTEIVNNKILENGHERGFNKSEIEKILDLCKHTKDPKYKQIRKELELPLSTKFKRIDYFNKETGETLEAEMAENVKFNNKMEGFHKLRLAITQATTKIIWENLSKDRDLINKIATVLTYEKNDKDLTDGLTKEFEKANLTDLEKEKIIEALVSKVSFSDFIHLSIKAVENILPFMKQGLTYDKACEKYGYEFKGVAGEKSKFLPPLSKEEQNELTNPVVKRTIAQLRKVVNAIIRKHGQFDKIHIELTRDIKRSHKDRMQIQREQKDFKTNKEQVAAAYKEFFGEEPNGKNLLKFRLWQEQNERCAYSGETIERARIPDHGYVEIDHILPFSRSFDDSLNNKVLVLAKENQNKRNRTPYEYLTEGGKNWAQFEGIVSSFKNMKKAKRDRLLKKNFDENSENSFKERNKNDTSYLSRYIKNYIENKLEFRDNGKTQKVFTRNGQLTKLLRHAWGVQEKNRDNHLHHAEDALILAFSTQSEVQKLSTISAKREQFLYETVDKKQEKAKFTPPYENFKNNFEESINEIFVSVAPRRKVTGAAHKETVYSKKTKTKGVFEVNGGLAENGEVKRVDIFQKDDKFHFIYMYPSDFIATDLKMTTIKGIEIDDTFDFQFSIFKDELIEIKQKDKERIFGYFKYPLSDGRLAIEPDIKNAKFNESKNRYTLGKLEYIKKYQVDPLGNYTEVKNEKRVGTIKTLKDKKNGMADSSNH